MKKILALLLAAVMLLSAQALATEPAQAFTDVSKQDYFYDAVNWAVEKEPTPPLPSPLSPLLTRAATPTARS